ncbi:hypothetical protein SOVF_053020 [Spinacia oleracea]|nr:hypothetical protein SOVF_053020 [Spinacia oleracea]
MSSSGEAKWIQHNKHTKHPLKEVYKYAAFVCKSCNCEGEGSRYQCEKCNVNIHPTCGTCPDTISSFAHPQHVLQLMEKPKLPFHKCHLCQNHIKGVVYRCKECGFFVHPVCSQLPEYLPNHTIHPPHTLKLQLMVSRKCDVCDKSCKRWRYVCEICNVHLHVGCLSGKSTSHDDDEGGFGRFLGGVIDIVLIATS